MTYSMVLNGGALVTNGAAVPYAAGFTADVIADGTGFGNPETLTRTINTLMTSGSWEITDPKRGNRGPSLVIEITGTTADGLNAGEAWLSSLMTPGALEWLPPGQTVWTVFDVTSCFIERSEDDRWDEDEVRWVRRYRVPIKSLPYARSRDRVSTPAEPVGTPVDAQINDGSSLTGWSLIATSTTGAALSSASGAVRATWDPSLPFGSDWSQSGVTVRYAPTFSVSDARFLRVDHDNRDGVQLRIDGVQLPSAYYTPATGSYYAEYFRLPVGVTSVSNLEIRSVVSRFTYSGTFTFNIDQVRKTSQLPGSGKQRLMALAPGGSAPAEGSLHVYNAAAALGRTIVYTYPAGRPSPALMQYKTAGASTSSDSALINDPATVLLGGLTLTIPDAALPVRGLVALWAKVGVTTSPRTLTWAATSRINGTQVGLEAGRSISLPVGAYMLVPLGLFSMAAGWTGTGGSVQIVFSQTGSGGNIAVDEVWAFGCDDESSLTIVDAGTGTPAAGGPSSHLWIDPPTAETPAGRITIGTSAADARTPSDVQSRKVHKFPPGGVTVLTVTTGSTGSLTELAHFRRWTHHAGS